MDLDVLTESDILVLESVLDTKLSKKDLQDPKKVERILDKIQDEIKNPKISNVIINQLVCYAIALAVGAVIGTISVGIMFATYSLAPYVFCIKIAPIIGAAIHAGMMITLNNREDKIINKIEDGIEKLEKKKAKETDPKKKKYLQENINALKESLKVAEKGRKEIRKTKEDESSDHPVKSFAARFFTAR